MPGLVPKMGAIATLTLTCGAIHAGNQPLELHLATYFGFASLAAALVNRWFAGMTMLVSAAGVLTVFIGYARAKSGITWNESTAMVAFGLTIVFALMVLVEQKEEPCESLSSPPDAADA